MQGQAKSRAKITCDICLGHGRGQCLERCERTLFMLGGKPQRLPSAVTRTQKVQVTACSQKLCLGKRIQNCGSVTARIVVELQLLGQPQTEARDGMRA